MKIDFYFDPICPWCWITSRWLTQVQEDRDLEVSFKSFSLAIKNDILHGESDSPYAEPAKRTHKLLRVVEEIRKRDGDAKVADFYTKVGSKIHIDGSQDLDWLAEVLSELGYGADVVLSADDESLDTTIEASMQGAFEVAGDDIGVPVLAVETSEGMSGFFGPVISELPDKEEGLKLFDGISEMVSFPHFYELKRTRTVEANTQSTASAQVCEINFGES